MLWVLKRFSPSVHGSTWYCVLCKAGASRSSDAWTQAGPPLRSEVLAKGSSLHIPRNPNSHSTSESILCCMCHGDGVEKRAECFWFWFSLSPSVSSWSFTLLLDNYLRFYSRNELHLATKNNYIFILLEVKHFNALTHVLTPARPTLVGNCVCQVHSTACLWATLSLVSTNREVPIFFQWLWNILPNIYKRPKSTC